MKAFLAARSIFFVVLLPGTVAGYVPFRLLHSGGQLRWPALSLSACLAALTTLIGAVGSARFRLGVLCRRTRHAGAHRSAAATGREWALPFHEKSDVQRSRRRSPRAGLVLLKRSPSRVRGDGASLLPPFRCII
jgi:hypothetical protein